MFGLMKSRACSLPNEQRYHRRLHYCGTCKTIGRLYGQKTRLLLNYDTVFLAELLTAISGEDRKISQWSAAYQSFNCLSLPSKPDEMPLALEYAATATIVLTQFKIADQIADSNKARWKAIERLLLKSFRAASTRMDEWQFPFDELRFHLMSQDEREAEASMRDNTASPDEILNRVAEPTAIATAIMLSHGARLVGSENAGQTMYEIGYSFGALVYLLDALEDYEKDFRNRQFNALRAAFRLSGNRLHKEYKDQVAARIWSLAEKVEASIHELPISASRAESFISRLRLNLSAKLGTALPVLSHACDTKAKMTLKERWRAALATAKSLAGKHAATRDSKIIARLEKPLVFASILPVAMLLPHHTATANSYRECMSMAFNLMLLGSAFAPATAMSVHFSSQVPPDLDAGGGAAGDKTGRKGKKAAGEEGESARSHWYDCCDCCTCCVCIDGCDCC